MLYNGKAQAHHKDISITDEFKKKLDDLGGFHNVVDKDAYIDYKYFHYDVNSDKEGNNADGPWPNFNPMDEDFTMLLADSKRRNPMAKAIVKQAFGYLKEMLEEEQWVN